MHDLGLRLGGFGRPMRNSRSSVASKRFPLSDEWLARFRFAWMFFTPSGPNGTASSEKNLRNLFEVSRELKGEG
jgi:hypothetical protein